MGRVRFVMAACLLASCHPAREHEAARVDAAAPGAVSIAARDAGEAPVADAGASAALPVDAGPATVEHVKVPKDRDAVLVRGPGSDGAITRAVFLPGICSNATAYLSTFPEAARAHGGILALDGDKPCGAPDSGFRSFTWSGAVQRTRIDAALAATGLAAPPDGFTLVGYSAGSSIAEMIHAKWPELFPRLVLIAPPDDPKLDYLLRAKAVVSMSCSLDVPARMKNAARRLNAKGVRSTYIEMPGCTHGNVADGERVFGEAFDFLDGPGSGG
jgi:pimeloyl-ACP methyl ester carboxylesterase